jgi:hypothetical protein
LTAPKGVSFYVGDDIISNFSNKAKKEVPGEGRDKNSPGRVVSPEMG